VVSGIIYTVRTYGFCALYHGLLPTLLGSIPKAGIRFGLFAWLSELLRDSEGNLSIARLFLAGLAAGAIEALVVVVPVETVKTKCIQLKMPFLQGLREILIIEGISGIYHGVFATVLKQSSVSFDSVYALLPFMLHCGQPRLSILTR
jgi:solute carrier family 25 citrate transporter 1